MVESSLERLEARADIGERVAALRRSNRVHTFSEVSGIEAINYIVGPDVNAVNGVGTDTITYLPLSVQGENDEVLTLEEALVHELSHAEDRDTGTEDRAETSGITNFEIKAVQMENQVRDKARTTFGGKDVHNYKGKPKSPRVKTVRRPPPRY
jgi:hypothetical protein